MTRFSYGERLKEIAYGIESPEVQKTKRMVLGSPQGIRWIYNPPISQLKKLVGYGYNVASVNWRPPREWGQQQYLDVVRAAEQAGIQLMPWMGWSASSIEKVMEWIWQSPAIWGWYSHDEPTTGGASVEGQEEVYNALKKYDPHRRPVVSCFTSGDWRAWAPHTFDIGAFDIYPYAFSPDDPEWFLSYWANRYANVFGEAGKEVIPMLQGVAWTGEGKPLVQPNPVEEYGWWQASQMPLYPNSYGVFGGQVHSQAAELARLLGWSPAPPPPPPETFTIQETACPQDKSVFRVKVSSVAENNKVLACPVDGTALPLKGVEITEIVAIPLIDTLKAEIAILDKKIAELQDRIEALKAQKAEAIEIIGV